MKKKKSRVVPNVNIYPIEQVPAEALASINLLIDTVHDEVYPAIDQAIKDRKSTAVLFQINFTNAYLELPKSEWEKAINSSIEHYSSKEKYEICSKLAALKAKIQTKKQQVNGRVQQHKTSNRQTTKR